MTVSEDISFSLLPSSGYRKLMVFRKIIFSKSQFVYYFQRLTRAKYISMFLLKILNIKYKYCKQNNLSSMSNRNSLSLPASSYIIKKQFICRFKLFSNYFTIWDYRQYKYSTKLEKCRFKLNIFVTDKVVYLCIHMNLIKCGKIDSTWHQKN